MDLALLEIGQHQKERIQRLVALWHRSHQTFLVTSWDETVKALVDCLVTIIFLVVTTTTVNGVS